MSKCVILLVFIVFSIPMVLSDLKTMYISISVNYAGAAAEVLVNFLLAGSGAESILAGTCAFIFLFIIKTLSRGGLGDGDLHYGFFCGTFLLLHNIFIGLFFASLSGIFAFCLATVNGKRREERLRIPFVPFMFAASLFSFVLKISV